jgi:hypothetical protein
VDLEALEEERAVIEEYLQRNLNEHTKRMAHIVGIQQSQRDYEALFFSELNKSLKSLKTQ